MPRCGIIGTGRVTHHAVRSFKSRNFSSCRKAALGVRTSHPIDSPWIIALLSSELNDFLGLMSSPHVSRYKGGKPWPTNSGNSLSSTRWSLQS